MVSLLNRLQECSGHDAMRTTCIKQWAVVGIIFMLSDLVRVPCHVTLAMYFLSRKGQLCLINCSILGRGLARATVLWQLVVVNFEWPCCHSIHHSVFDWNGVMLRGSGGDWRGLWVIKLDLGVEFFLWNVTVNPQQTAFSLYQGQTSQRRWGSCPTMEDA